MEQPKRRNRASTVTSVAAFSYPLNTAVGTDLQNLLKNLSDSIEEEPTADILQAQCDDLRRIRQLLIEHGHDRLGKDALRHLDGLRVLLDVLQPVGAHNSVRRLPQKEKSEVFQLLKSVLDVLSEAIRDHSGNRKYFAKRVDGDGWDVLYQRLLRLDVLELPDNEKNPGFAHQAHLFGILCAFALGEESIAPVFRNVHKAATTDSQRQQDRNQESESIAALRIAEDVNLQVLQDCVRRFLSGKETLLNPEAVLILLRLCHVFLAADAHQHSRIVLINAVLVFLIEVAAISVRNCALIYRSESLSVLLPMAFGPAQSSAIHSVVLDLCNRLVVHGTNGLEDAYFLFNAAAQDSRAADFVLKAIGKSRGPSFVHFDLSLCGYSSIELPTIGRQFPPTSNSNGYTFTLWFRVDQYDKEVHTTLFGAFDRTQTCFLLAYLEKDTRHLILQTSIRNIKQPSIRFKCVAFEADRWYHVAVAHRRPRTTSSSRASLFVDGNFTEQIKCNYPSTPPATTPKGSTESFATLTTGVEKQPTVQVFLGTPQDVAPRLGKNVVTSKWSLASFQLFSEVLSDELVAVLQKLGPRYNGNFQDCLGSFLTYKGSAELNRYNEMLNPGQEEKSDIISALHHKASNLLPEHKLLVNFSPDAVLSNTDVRHVNESSLLRTLPKDASQSLRRMLRAGSNAMIINTAVPSFSDALTCPQGVGTLTGEPVVVIPQPLDDDCWRIAGSAAVGLKLIEVARTKETVLHALGLVFASIQDNWRNSEAMEKENGYGVLAGLLREKLGFGSVFDERTTTRLPSQPVEPSQREELALELLRAVLKFVGYNEQQPEESLIINPLAYRTLLVDFDTWRRTPIATQKLYYSQFVQFAGRNENRKFNVKRLIRMRLVRQLLNALKGEVFSVDVFPDFIEAFGALLHCNPSTENLRSLALFVTYAFQDSRAFPTSITRAKSTRRPLSRGVESDMSTPRSITPVNDTNNLGPTLSRYEMGIQVLEMFTELLCDPTLPGITEKFAKTVTNKWLLFMLDEPDPRVVFLTTKFLARVLLVHGPPYVAVFAEKNGGFSIMKHRLKTWWSLPSIWIVCFALLFGHDVTTINFNIEFNHFGLSEMFSSRPLKVVHERIFPVITAMLQNGLGHVSRSQGDQPQSSGSASNGTKNNSSEATGSERGEAVDAADMQRLSDAEILNTVIRFLTDLHLKWPSFREWTAAPGSSYVKDLLFVLYPVVVTSDSVSADTELNSRGSALTFEGQDVVIRPHATSENQRPPIVRTSTADAAVSGAPRATPFRRASSFILITSDSNERLPTHARFNSVISPSGSAPISLRVGNFIVEGLLQVILGVFLDQLLERKEFSGFGLFQKVPPGFQEHQVYFESYVLDHAMSTLSNNLRLNQRLMTEPRVLTNLARYAHHMAEAVFEGWFLNGAEPLLDFVGTILEYVQKPDVAKLKNVRLCSAAIVSMRSVFRRVALLRLSELDSTESEQKSITFLEKMMYWQTIIMSIKAETDEDHFLRLMFYLLYMKLVSRTTSVRSAAVNLWRMLLVQKPTEALSVLKKASGDYREYLAEGFMKLAQVDNETFFIWVDRTRQDLDQLFFIGLARYWEEFVAGENAKTEETANNRLNKRREKLRIWQDAEANAEAVWRKHESGTSHWRNNVYSAERMKHQRAMQDQQDNLASMAATVERLDAVLKGPCKLFEEDPPPKWRLDGMESRHRMRMRLIQDKTILAEDYQPKRKTGEFKKTTSIKINTNVTTTADKALISTPTQPPANAAVLSPGRQRATSTASNAPEDEFEIIDDPNEDEDGFEDRHRKVMRSLQQGEVIQHVCNVSRIVGLEACEGLLIVGKQSLYLIDHFFQRSDGEVVRVWQAPTEERDPYLQMILGKATNIKKTRVAPGERTSRHWGWTDVILISKRRFLFRDVALEIFFTDGQSFLLTAINPEVRDDLYAKLVARSPLLKDPSAGMQSEDAWRLQSLRNPEEVPQSFGHKFASVFNNVSSNPATRKWMKGEMSNFAYLMLINTMAGRTFNDLTQYPVFPWVLADYTSEVLDLSDPKTFRDLSKPMGAQVPSRESDFRDRYQAYADMDSGTPPFHYGTHYSSAMVVSSYLIRLQPFVKSYLLLQGGNFDHADRLFFSIEKAWLSSSRDSTTDVRELVPEFFYLPAFLQNLNGYNFGNLKQGFGEAISDVKLPPWAHGDPYIFIAKHREALESPYVSMHLHKWIDLIFGCKQRGEAAIEATNVFHHLSYHGAKDLDSIDDPVEKIASIGIIHNFGQTPHQVFVRPHPQREDILPRWRSLDSNAESLSPSTAAILETPGRIGTLVWHPKVERLLHTNPFRVLMPPSYSLYLDFGFADASLRFFEAEKKKQIALYEHLHQGHIAAAAFLDSRTLVTAGDDAVIAVWTVALVNKSVDLQQQFNLFGHRAGISALAVSKPFATVVSADRTGRTLAWDVNRGEFIREILPAGGQAIPYIRIQGETGDIALLQGKKTVHIFGLNGRAFTSADVCAGDDLDDECTALAWCESFKSEWVRRRLLCTGHRNGVVKVWCFGVSEGESWGLTLIKALPHPAADGPAPIVAVLPMVQGLYAADDNGRFYEWHVGKHD